MGVSNLGEQNILRFLREIPGMVEEHRVVLLVLDGLGTNQIKTPRTFRKRTYRTVFPSSTPNFLYSLHSLLEPKQHGFLDWYMWFNRFSEPVMIPPWKTASEKELKLGKDVTREDVFPFKSLSEVLWGKGFTTHVYTPYPDSTFTLATTRKAKVTGIKYFSQVFPLPGEDFILIYWPSIDTILHENYKSEAFKVEKEILSIYLELLWEKLPGETMLVVCSDHGLTRIAKSYVLPRIDNTNPVGGGRTAFYRSVDPEEVAKKIGEEKIPAKVFHINDLEGFKGRINRRCVELFGDVVVVADNQACFRYPFQKEKTSKLGHHGGMSKEEVYVDVYVALKK